MSYNQYYNVVTNANTIWALSRDVLNELIISLYTDTFLNNVQLLFEKPIDNITSLRVYPFDVANMGANEYREVKIGRVGMGEYCWGYRMLTTQYEFTVYADFILPKYNNFLDMSPYTRIELYLPYIGYIDITPDEVIGKKIQIKYYVDVLCGRCMAEISYLDGDEWYYLNSVDGQIGVEIPIGGGGYAEVARNLLMVGASATTAIISGGATLPILSGALVSGMNSSKLNIQKKGTLQPYLNFNLPQKLYIRITRPRYVQPSDFGAVYGFPLNETRRLNTLSGFTKVKDVHLDDFEGATLNEINEIESILKSGVILPGGDRELTFKVNNSNYVYTSGMTWGMWASSPFNIDGWLQGDDGEIYRPSNGGREVIMGVDVHDTIFTTRYSTQFVKDQITFLIDGSSNMTYVDTSWAEWVTSIFNVNGWYVEGNEIRQDIPNGYRYISGGSTSTSVTPQDTIFFDDYITTNVFNQTPFTIDSIQYSSYLGSSWVSWVNSNLNPYGIFKTWENYVYRFDDAHNIHLLKKGGAFVNNTETVESLAYTTEQINRNKGSFTMYDGVVSDTLYVLSGDTWGEWVTTPYNQSGFHVYNGYVCVNRGGVRYYIVSDPSGIHQSASSTVVNGGVYAITNSQP